MQVGQLAKQLVDIPNNLFNVNTHTNPKEYCSLVEGDHNIVVEMMEEEAEKGPDEEELQEENCEIIQQILPQKDEDPRVVILPVTIGGTNQK